MWWLLNSDTNILITNLFKLVTQLWFLIQSINNTGITLHVDIHDHTSNFIEQAKTYSKHNTYCCSLNISIMISTLAVPSLRWLVASLSQWRPGFNPSQVHVGFVVEKVALGQVFLQALQFSPVSINPSVLHAYSLICHQLTVPLNNTLRKTYTSHYIMQCFVH